MNRTLALHNPRNLAYRHQPLHQLLKNNPPLFPHPLQKIRKILITFQRRLLNLLFLLPHLPHATPSIIKCIYITFYYKVLHISSINC